MNLIVEIKFLDYWHLSSGISAGASGDSTVVKDENKIPFIPGKTLKGLARDMAEKRLFKKDEEEFKRIKNFVNTCFGYSSNRDDTFYDENKKGTPSLCYFANATLNKETYEAIKKVNLQNNLYDEISSTQIDKETGVAKTNNLREIEVVIPLTLYTKIENVPSEYKDLMRASLKSIKQMGLNRNRGLGRCIVSVKEEENE